MNHTMNVSYLTGVYNNFLNNYDTKNSREAVTTFVDKVAENSRDAAVSETQSAGSVSTENMTMEEYKQYIYDKISQLTINPSRMQDTISINISEAGFEAMKNDPEYEEWVLNYLQEDFNCYNPWTSACGGCYCVKYIGATKEEYHGESWYAGYQNGTGKSLYDEKSQDSFWERRAERKQRLEEQYEELQEVAIYAEKAGNKNEVSDSDTQEKETDYQQIIQEYIEKIFVKLENGETEESYQIGGSSFTIKEWEEFLNKFDSIEEAIQKLIEEEQEEKEAEETQKENMVINDTGTLLTTEFTSCTYETADPDDDIRYITWYTGEGIFCRRAGQTEGYEWSLAFKDKEQYDKVMEFIGQFPSDWNMRFAAHENFWNDFLNDEIDMDGFMEFINGTNKGVPDFSVTVGDSMYVDRDKVQWAKYTNPLGTRFYTAEEMHRMQMEIIAANKAKLKN